MKIKNFLLKLQGWVPCKDRLPQTGTVVKVRSELSSGIGYLTEGNKWIDLAQNAFSIDFTKGIRVDYWKEDK